MKKVFKLLIGISLLSCYAADGDRLRITSQPVGIINDTNFEALNPSITNVIRDGDKFRVIVQGGVPLQTKVIEAFVSPLSWEMVDENCLARHVTTLSVVCGNSVLTHKHVLEEKSYILSNSSEQPDSELAVNGTVDVRLIQKFTRPDGSIFVRKSDDVLYQLTMTEEKTGLGNFRVCTKEQKEISRFRLKVRHDIQNYSLSQIFACVYKILNDERTLISKDLSRTEAIRGAFEADQPICGIALPVGTIIIG